MAMLCLLRVLSCWSKAIPDLRLLFFYPEDALHGKSETLNPALFWTNKQTKVLLHFGYLFDSHPDRFTISVGLLCCLHYKKPQ